MDSHQLPASLTVRSPDLTSCLGVEKIKHVLIFEKSEDSVVKYFQTGSFIRYLRVREVELSDHFVFAEAQICARGG